MKHIFRAVPALVLVLALLFAAAVPAAAAEPAVTEIDYHRYSQLLVDIAGQRCVDEAIQVIDAFLAGESSVTFDDSYVIGDIAAVQALVGVMCPVFGGTTFSGWDCFDEDTRTYSWKALYTSEETAELTQEFEAVCMGYLDDLQAGDSDLVKFLVLYYDFTGEREYNFNLQEEIDAAPTSEDQTYVGSALRCMIEYTGQCATLSQCYAFLCLQAGLNAFPVNSYTSDLPHAWDVIEIDGSYYYCDPTWDLPSDGNPAGLNHFGMTAEVRSNEGGYTLEDSYFLLNSQRIDPASLGLDNDRFSALYYWPYTYIVSMTVDHEANTVTVTNTDGESSVIG